MRALRAAWRLARMLLHLLHGIAVMALRFPALDAAGRQQRIQGWSAKLLRLAGLQLRVSGAPRPGATLLVANHVSWLDIAAIHAVAPQARFVSKAEVLRWPLLGWLIRGAGTLFIERERKRDALRVLHQVAAALQAGDTVAVFPEGTTGDGAALLPFHANLLQSAIATGTPVQCVALRYSDAAQRFSPAAQFLGQTTLLQSVWRVLGASALQVHVELLPPQGARHADRRALAAYLRSLIEARLHAAPAADEPPRTRAGTEIPKAST
ncbi:MAG TPA: lysophospholipid acyltransferase family protein [Rubrivivax sp.]|nr:lysophospholipid acyltransferase family protein [Rubrivivax sp.]